MEYWNEIRTAAVVAKHKTISKSADELNVHRATVTRHIDRLENELNAKLFQRHPKGFTPTDLGARLLQIADVTQSQFNELYRFAKKGNENLSGEITITCLDVLEKMILPYLTRFRTKHPQVSIKLISTDNLLKLEYGEADMAFRVGPKPTELDNVVIAISEVEMGLFASNKYIDEFGTLTDVKEFGHHVFIGADRLSPKAPFTQWINQHIPAEKIVLKCNSILTMWQAVESGIGIGFLPENYAKETSKLTRMSIETNHLSETLWGVIHVDVLNTNKVQAMLKVIKART